ncbi:hypothetical protein BGZ58_003627 [Dissophora ornata]|nr:hypothetical protein BGZ58_003627 [Dissophora ornata]
MESKELPHYKHVNWESPEVTFRMYLSYVSLFFDVAVLAYHFSTPFHPKIPTVLGIKAFLVPSLGIVTALHGYFAINLALNPTSFHYLLSTYMTVHIYAWSRVFFALYYRFKLFEAHRFSAAMLTSGMLLVPSVMGLHGNVMLLTGVLTADIFLRYTKDNEFWVSWTTEHPRELASFPEKKVVLEALITAAEVSNIIDTVSLNDPKARYAHICSKVMSANLRDATPRAKAMSVFKAIDVNQDNELSIEEFQDFLVACGISQYDMEYTLMLDDLFQGKKFADFDSFCAWFTKNWIHSNSISIPQLPKTPRGQAKLVFDTLDSDGSGALDLDELEHLLTSWGLPKSEALGYLKSANSIRP